MTAAASLLRGARRLKPGTLVGVLALAAFAVRVYHLGYQSLWRDESDALRFATQPLPDFFRMFSAMGQNGPLFFLTLRPWLAVAGHSEFALRFLSAACGTLAVPVTYRLLRSLAGRRPALLLSVFMAVAPYLVWYGQEAKMYALLTLLIPLSLWLAVLAVRRSRWYHWAGLYLVTSLAIYNHLLVPLIIPVQIVWLLLAPADADLGTDQERATPAPRTLSTSSQGVCDPAVTSMPAALGIPASESQRRRSQTAGERPERAAAQPPERTAGEQPEGTAGERPEGAAAEQPEGTAGQQLEGAAAQRLARSVSEQMEEAEPGAPARRGLKVLVYLAALGLPYLPILRWAVPLLLNGYHSGFEFVPLPQMLATLVGAWSRGVLPNFGPTALPMLLGVVAGGFFWGPAAGGRGASRVVAMLLAWLVLPPLEIYLISLASPVYVDRYLIWVMPAFLALASLGVVVLTESWRPLGLITLAGILALNVADVAGQTTRPLKSDFRAAAAYVRAERRPGDRLLFQIPYVRDLFEYYAGPAGDFADGPYTNYGMDQAQLGDLMAAETAGTPAVWLISSETNLWDARGMTQAWLDAHATVTRHQDFTLVSVTRYQLVAR